MHDVARQIVALAEAGLERRARLGADGLDEQHYLTPLRNIVESGQTIAEWSLAAFEDSWQGSLEPLFRDCAY